VLLLLCRVGKCMKSAKMSAVLLWASEKNSLVYETENGHGRNVGGNGIERPPTSRREITPNKIDSSDFSCLLVVTAYVK
jgi:hypothetical protein